MTTEKVERALENESKVGERSDLGLSRGDAATG
jgi:hypothetical protein